MRRAAVVAISAVVVVGVAAGATALAIAGRAPASTEDDRYPVTEPYTYPDVDFAGDPAANIEMLRIPADELGEMTTEALAWSVVDFPYFGNFLASSQVGGGVDFLRPQCDALDALLERDDAEAAVQAVRAAFAGGEVEDEFGELKVMLLDEILAWL